MSLSAQGMVERASAEITKCITGLGLRGRSTSATKDRLVTRLNNSNSTPPPPPPRTCHNKTPQEKPGRILGGRGRVQNGYSSPSLLRRRTSTPTRIRSAEPLVTPPLTLDLWQDEKFLTKFFRYFNHTEKANLAQVCKHWRDILYHPRWWIGQTAIIHWRRLQSHSGDTERTKEIRRRFFASLQRRGFDAICLQSAGDSDMSELVALLSTAAAGKIKSLSVRYCPLSDKGMETLLDHFQSVTSIELVGCNELTEAGLWASLPPRLQSLSLADCIHVADEAVGAVAQLLPALQEFNIQAYHVTDGGLGYLGARPNPSLTALRLRSCWEITNQGILNIVHSLPSLTILSLSGCSKLTDDAVELIAEGLPRLRTLDLSWCPRITDAALEYIACDLSSLQELVLDRCVHVTDIGVGYISTMLSLTALYLRWCTQLRDFGLQHLCSMRNINMLSLAGCPLLTSSGLSGLTQLRQLQELELTNCPGTSGELIEYLKQHLPQCNIIL